MQLPAQADPPKLKELAEKLRAIEPAVAEGCDGSEIERDRGKLIAAILAIVVEAKNLVEALTAYKRHWPKGRGSKWGQAFKLIASNLGSSTRTLYRFIKSIAKGVMPDRKWKRKVERPDGDGKAKRIGEESGAQTAQSPDSIAKAATEALKDRLGDALVRQLLAAFVSLLPGIGQPHIGINAKRYSLLFRKSVFKPPVLSARGINFEIESSSVRHLVRLICLYKS